MPTIEVFASGDWIGFHRWPNAPERVKFLSFQHRHKFCWRAWWRVAGHDRDIEFCAMKERVTLALRFQANKKESEMWSCEKWALYILQTFDCSRVEVSEDGENGAVVTA